MRIIRDIYSVLPAEFRRRGVWVAFSLFLRAVLDFAGVAVLVPVMVKVLEKDGNPMSALPVALVALGFIICKNLVSVFLAKFRSGYVYSLYAGLSEKVLGIFVGRGLMFVKRSDTVDLSNKVNAVTMSFVSALLSLLNVFSAIVLLVIIIAALFVFDPFATAVIIAVMGPLMFAFSYLIRKRMKNLGVEENQARRTQLRTVLESFRGYSDFAVNEAFPFQFSKFRSSVGRVSEVRRQLEVWSSVSFGFMEVAVILTIIIIMLLSFTASWNISVTFGVFALAALKILPSVRMIVGGWQTFQSSSYSIDILKEILGQPGVMQEAGQVSDQALCQVASESGMKLRDRIAVRNLSFKYPDTDEYVYKGLDLEIARGEYVGIKGASGVGKTTLFNLLMGFYFPESGGVYVDGILLTPENAGCWRHNIGYVPQDVFLINGSFAENIAFGETLPDREKIELILKKLGLWSWISSLDEGMDTLIAEAGNSISGGQKQRIGIARALYKDADVLFLDEATSSVDVESEMEINRCIAGLMAQDDSVTVIVIAHRQETLAACRRVIDLL